MENVLPPVKTVPSGVQDDATASPVASPKSPWVLGLCSVLFDVDKGQTLQDVWPLDCLSEEETAAVAFHAFPDSLSMELYTRNAVKDSSFTFRIKREPEGYTSAGVPEFLYGYVFCRQRQDESLRRGGEQVSVLVLSTAPFSSALLPLSQAAGHAFFNEGPMALAMVYNQVLSWPLPVPGSSMCLPIGAAIINARLPHFSIMPPPQPAVDPSVQATLLRRVSRALSLKASGSPRMNAVAAAAAAASGPDSTVNLQHAPPEAPLQDAEPGAAPAALAVSTQPLQQQSATSSAGSLEAEGAGGQPAAAAATTTTAAATARQDSPELAVDEPGTGTGPAASAAAADDSDCAVFPQHAQPEQQLQEEQQSRGMSRGGSFTSLLGMSFSSSRSGSSSRLARPDSSAAGRSSSSGADVERGNSGSAPSGNGGSSSGGAGCEWLASTLGQQWREEKAFPEVEPALVLAPLLRDLWTLWQLVVTGQPLMVVGLNPGETCAAVAALVSLVSPLPYAADFRPFFTIHDPDFVAMAAGQLPKRQRYHEVLPQQQQSQQELQGEQQQQQQQQANGQDPSSQEGSQPGLQPAQMQPPPQPGDSEADQPQEQQQEQQQQLQDQQPQPLQPPLPPPPPPPHSKAAPAAKHWNLPALIGITNLSFVKLLPKWPNVVAISRKEVMTPPPSHSSRGGSPAKPSRSSGAAGTPQDTSVGGAAAASATAANRPSSPPLPPAGSRAGSGFFSSTAAAAMRALQRRHQGPQHLLSHFAPHLWTAGKHLQLVKPDYTLLSKARAAIEPAVGSAGGAAQAASSSGSSCMVVGPSSAAGTAAARLQRHFAELTAALLAPFETYFSPGPSGKVPAWRPEAFLANLSPSTLPPVLTARLSGNSTAAATALYAAFIESPNFAFWFQQRRAPVLHLVEDEPESEEEGFAEVEAGEGDSSDAGVESEPDEVELVQQLLSTEQAITDLQQQMAAAQQPADAKQLQQQEQALQLEFAQAFRQLPRDVQAALFSSPARQELLQDAAAALAAGTCVEQEAAAGVLQKMQELMIGASGDPAAA